MIEAGRINLLPGFVAARRRARRILQGSTLVASAAAVACAVTYLSQGFALRDARSELAVQQAENAVIAQDVAKLAELETMQIRLDATHAALATLFADEVRWSSVFADLQAVIPGNTWLTGMTVTMSPTDDGIGSVAFQGTTMNHVSVGLWLQRLSRVPGFHDPYFSISSKQTVGDREVVTFSSTVTVTDLALRSQQPGAAR